jgi:hypothetical protein
VFASTFLPTFRPYETGDGVRGVRFYLNLPLSNKIMTFAAKINFMSDEFEGFRL